MAASSLNLFGAPAFETAAGREPLTSARPFQLLVYLACRGTWVARDVAATLLWPERDTSTARANLRFVLVQIRRLPQIEGLETRPDALRWTVETDVRRFESAAAEARWADAIDTCSGPLLEGFELGAPAPYVEWLQFERARLEGLWRTALSARMEQLVADPAACVALATRALQFDPIDASALTYLMRAQQSLGQCEEARRAYRDYAQRLAAEFGIEPSAALREIARGLDPQRTNKPEVPAAPATAASPPSTLIGRRLELARIRQLLLGDECRVLTITGPGGVGKSTLARAALPAMTSEFADGACWIALDDLGEAGQVATRCATQLGLELRGSASPQQQLIERLRTARALLVFDNAEHLSGFPAWLDALLMECGRIKAMVTSRARLELAAEWLVPLEGLPVPDADETEVDALRASDAVRLFEARARAQNPDFDAAHCAVDVAALARATEGLPLALELAAARVRLLPVAEIAREITQSIDLVEPATAATDRNRSLRASFAHSWRLLAPRERSALSACTVFPGSFSREAAQVIADAPLSLLGALADKSLLRPDGGGRFSLHSLIRQCAADYVADARGLRRRHAEYFAQLLAGHAEFRLTNQRLAIAEIEREFAHCRAAWQQAVEDGSCSLIGRIAPALRHFFEATGRWTEGIEMLSAALAAIEGSAESNGLTGIGVRNALAALHWRRADFAESEQYARAALALAREADDRTGVKAALNTIGLSLWQMGRYDDARSIHEEALSYARADGDRYGIAQFSSNLAIIEKAQGNLGRAADLYEEALAIERQTGNQRGLVTRLNNLGNLYRARHDWPSALRCFEEGLQVAQASGLAAPAVFLLVNLGLTTLELGELDRSEQYARQGLDEARTHGEPQIEIMARLALARLAIARDEPARAASFVREAISKAQATGYTLCELAAMNVHASALAARGERIQAATVWRVVIRHPMAYAGDRADAEDGITRLALNDAEAEATRVGSEQASFDGIVAAIVASTDPN